MIKDTVIKALREKHHSLTEDLANELIDKYLQTMINKGSSYDIEDLLLDQYVIAMYKGKFESDQIHIENYISKRLCIDWQHTTSTKFNWLCIDWQHTIKNFIDDHGVTVIILSDKSRHYFHA